MANVERLSFSNHSDYSNEVITLRDLALFKVQLLQEIRNLLSSQPDKKESQKWMKSPEVQKLLDISRGKLLSLRISGKLPYTRIGGVIYYNQDDIKCMMESNRERLSG